MLCETLDELGEKLSSVGQLKIRGAAGLQQRLEEHWSQVLLARRLTALATDIPDIAGLPSFSLNVESLSNAEAYLCELNLQGPLTRRCKKLADGMHAS